MTQVFGGQLSISHRMVQAAIKSLWANGFMGYDQQIPVTIWHKSFWLDHCVFSCPIESPFFLLQWQYKNTFSARLFPSAGKQRAFNNVADTREVPVNECCTTAHDVCRRGETKGKRYSLRWIVQQAAIQKTRVSGGQCKNCACRWCGNSQMDVGQQSVWPISHDSARQGC